MTSEFSQRNRPDWPNVYEGLVAVVVLTVFLLIVRGRLSKQYRTPATGETDKWRFGADVVAGLFAVIVIGLGVMLGVIYPGLVPVSWPLVGDGAMYVTPLFVLASVVWAYRWRRFQVVRTTVKRKRGKVCYAKYAQHSGEMPASGEEDSG